MVLSTGIYDCSALDGFIAWNKEGEMIGLITYILRDTECEVISLDSIEEGKVLGQSFYILLNKQPNKSYVIRSK